MSSNKSVQRDKLNAYIHVCYVKKDFVECKKAIETQLKSSSGPAEYPLYIKGIY
jgi:hypothetical protein